MTFKRFGLASLVPVEFQTMSLANSTSIAVNSTCQAGNVIIFSVEDQNARMRSDGTSPTLTTGVLFQKDDTYLLGGYNGTSVLEFCRQTGTCIVQLEAYQFPGEGRT